MDRKRVHERGFGPQRHDPVTNEKIDATITIEENSGTNLVPITEILRHPLLSQLEEAKPYVKEVEEELSLAKVIEG